MTAIARTCCLANNISHCVDFFLWLYKPIQTFYSNGDFYATTDLLLIFCVDVVFNKLCNIELLAVN